MRQRAAQSMVEPRNVKGGPTGRARHGVLANPARAQYAADVPKLFFVFFLCLSGEEGHRSLGHAAYHSKLERS